jgi:hypothetical protein
MSSDQVTWETCPNCRRPAAAGWRNGIPVEFDCPAGCRISETQLRAFADRRRPAIDWLSRP